MIKVLKGFYATKERFDEINTALPEFVEWEDKTTEVTETSPYYV